jgi:hypothetical protein
VVVVASPAKNPMSRNMGALQVLSFINQQQQARLAQSVARETLNLKVVGSSPTSGFKQFFFACGCLMVVGVGGGVSGWSEIFGVNVVRAQPKLHPSFCRRRLSVFLFDLMPEP